MLRAGGEFGTICAAMTIAAACDEAGRIDVSCAFARTFTFEPRATALIAIDMQRDFLDPQGFCARAGDDISPLTAIVPRLGQVLVAGRAAGLTLIHTREGYAPDGADISDMKRERHSVGTPGPLGRFLVCGEPGQDFLPALKPHPDEPVFDKPGFSAFHRTGLDDHLKARGITHLILMGVTTQCCVHSTLRSAVDRGYWCLTVEDCCAAFDPDLHNAAISLIYGEEHLFGWVCRAADLIAALAPAPEA